MEAMTENEITGGEQSGAGASHVLALLGRAGEREVKVQTSSPDVLEALSRFDDASRGVLALIEIGAHAALAASTGFDINEVRREVDRVVGETTTALTGVRQQVLDAVGEDGPLARSLLAASEALARSLGELVEGQGNPDLPGTLVAKLVGLSRNFEESVALARKQVADELAKTADKYSDGLNKALREMRDLDPSSALGRAFSGMDKTLKDIAEMMAASAATRSERRKGTAKGGDYEEMVAAEVASIASIHGDCAERTGNQQGLLVKKERCYRGDVTCTIEGVPGIVIEAMDRGGAKLTTKLVQEELVEAMANRGAAAAIAVVSSTDNSLMCQQPIQFLSASSWAVFLDSEDPDVLALQVAYCLARRSATTPSEGGATLDVQQVKAIAEELASRLGGLADIRTQLTNIARCREAADAVLVRIERELKGDVTRLLGEVAGNGDRTDKGDGE
jgi:hypothetical protein